MLSNLLFHVKAFIARQDEKAQGLIEYALIILLIAIAVIAVLGLLGGQINNVFQNITDTLSGS